MFDFSVILPHWPQLLAGLGVCFGVSMAAIVLGFVFGWAICLGSVGPLRALSLACRLYVSFFRGTPLLVQLTLVFYALPALGISLPPLLAAVVALTLNTSAFQGEILRAGFRLLPRGQMEAARDLGLSRWQVLRHIQMPQVFRSMLPALTNETIDIIKNSALVSAVAVTELMRTAQVLASTTYRPIEFFVSAGLLYLLLTLFVARCGRWLESRLRAA
ncbi:ABC transporter permease subunit [Aromatoleum toluvorans]|uniref:ABC transporter permease subunit n=1 Tax=Aromatoleum toluvorans TaxID=92002 RepID=A0ABX1PX59_9RHOO|nr:amino acid ABC transporter permease [Aromatoleum toluvorans]NMG43215.1 ABC transporter permease subunit [Aromatoleum toluvorans]